MKTLNNYIVERIRIDNVNFDDTIDLELGCQYEIHEPICWHIFVNKKPKSLASSDWNVGVVRNTYSKNICILFWSPSFDIVFCVDHNRINRRDNNYWEAAVLGSKEYDTKNPNFLSVVKKKFPMVDSGEAFVIQSSDIMVEDVINNIVNKFKNKTY